MATLFAGVSAMEDYSVINIQNDCFLYPSGITVNPSNGEVFVCDNDIIRKITTEGTYFWVN